MLKIVTKYMFTKKVTDIPLVDKFYEMSKLCIIDDCAGKSEYKDLINNLVMDRRSKNCQIILLAQDFILIDPSIRRQARCISAFKHSGDSLDKLYQDMVKEVQPNKSKFFACANCTWNEKYSYFYINKINEIFFFFFQLLH